VIGLESERKRLGSVSVFDVSRGDLCGVSVRGPGRRFNGPWQFGRTRLSVCFAKTSLPTTRFASWFGDFERERCREIETGHLRTDCAFDVPVVRFAGLTSPRNVQRLAAALQFLLVLHRYN